MVPQLGLRGWRFLSHWMGKTILFLNILLCTIHGKIEVQAAYVIKGHGPERGLGCMVGGCVTV